MNKNFYLKLLSYIRVNDFPSLPCPYCEKGKLQLNQKSIRYMKLKDEYDSSSFGQEDFERGVLLGLAKIITETNEMMKWYQTRFIAFLICTACKEPVSLQGRARRPTGFEIHKHLKLTSELHLEYLSPPIPLFALRKEYPPDVNEELTRSFSNFFSDSSSAANRLRVAIELFLDSENVEKYRKSKSGEYKVKKDKLSLHERIKHFASQNEDCSKMLLGIKALGNESSHTSNISRQDLLEAYDIFEYILKHIFITVKVHKNYISQSEVLEKKYK